MHGLYSIVWNKQPEDSTFLETYYAKYRSRDEWTNLLKSEGYLHEHNTKQQKQLYSKADIDKYRPTPDNFSITLDMSYWFKNVFKYYYATYRKPSLHIPNSDKYKSQWLKNK
jgi:hypothetical protein